MDKKKGTESQKKMPEKKITAVDYIDTLQIKENLRYVKKRQYSYLEGVKTISEWKKIIK